MLTSRVPRREARNRGLFMQFGAYTFVETRRDPVTGEPVDVDKTFANVLEQIVLKSS